MPQVMPIMQILLAPAVLISACGLICLALYNRLAALVSRLRGFHHERLLATERLSNLGLEAQTSVLAHMLRERTATLDDQARQILQRARLLRNALLGLMGSVMSMLACSLTTGLSLLWPWLLWAVLGWYVLGVLSMIAGVVLAIRELWRSLEPVALEHASMGRLDGDLGES